MTTHAVGIQVAVIVRALLATPAFTTRAPAPSCSSSNAFTRPHRAYQAERRAAGRLLRVVGRFAPVVAVVIRGLKDRLLRAPHGLPFLVVICLFPHIIELDHVLRRLAFHLSRYLMEYLRRQTRPIPKAARQRIITYNRKYRFGLSKAYLEGIQSNLGKEATEQKQC